MTQLVDERDLRAALAPLRPDPEAFEAAVRARIERGVEPIGGEPLSRAAGWLPPGALELAAGGLGAKSLVGKLAGGLLALPVLAVAALTGTFVAGVHAVRRLDGTRDRGVDELDELRGALGYWRVHAWLHLAALAAMAVLTFTGHVDLVLGLMILSMTWIVLVSRRLSRAGLASRRHVGRWCGGVLFVLAMSMTRPLGGGSSLASWPYWLAAGVLYLGSWTCAYLAAPEEGFHGRKTMRTLLLAVVLMGLPVSLGLVVVLARVGAGALAERLGPAPGWLELRLPLGAVLMVALSLVATLRAPAAEGVEDADEEIRDGEATRG
jgi:hypothetical protein